MQEYWTRIFDGVFWFHRPSVYFGPFCHWGYFWGWQLASERIQIRLETFGTVHFHYQNQLFFVKLWKPALFSLGHQLLFLPVEFCSWLFLSLRSHMRLSIGLWVNPVLHRTLWHCSNEFIASFSRVKWTFFRETMKDRCCFHAAICTARNERFDEF